jgi:hypothetical protein
LLLHLSKRVADQARTHIRDSCEIVESHLAGSIRAEPDVLLEDALGKSVLHQGLSIFAALERPEGVPPYLEWVS